MSIATIIVNYNAGETLKRCVDALIQGAQRTEITVIDNASSDNSAQQLHSEYLDHPGIQFLFNPENPGFAAAVNRVAKRLDADYILVLNPDCILEPDALAQLKTALENDPHAALAGPAVRDALGRMQRATVRRFPTPWKSLMTASGLWRLGRRLPVFHGVEVDVSSSDAAAQICEAVGGACMFLRRDAFAEVGFFDEQYLMHCEDLDLMYRLAKNGWHCLYVPLAGSVHLQGLSSRSRPGWVHLQKHRSLVRLFNKFQAGTTLLPIRIMVYAAIWLRFIILWPLVRLRR